MTLDINNVERRWQQIRKDTGLDSVTPHTFRTTVATLISERVDTETASQQLGFVYATQTGNPKTPSGAASAASSSGCLPRRVADFPDQRVVDLRAAVP